MGDAGSSCAFCTIPAIRGREIVRTELAWAVPTNMPIVPGHVLILPIRCVATFEELTLEEQHAIFALQSQIVHSLKKTFGAEGFNFAWNQEKIAGQSVPHFHLHIVPRKVGDTGIYQYEPRQFLYRPGVRDVSPEEELQNVAEMIRDNL
jgi:histidine triad (HIT) family protein